MKTISFKAVVWVYPGLGGWHFVTLDKKLSAAVKKVGKSYGAGFIKVQAKIGKSVWKTALFPHKASVAYLLSIKKSIRIKEGIFEGDRIVISMTLL